MVCTISCPSTVISTLSANVHRDSRWRRRASAMLLPASGRARSFLNMCVSISTSPSSSSPSTPTPSRDAVLHTCHYFPVHAPRSNTSRTVSISTRFLQYRLDLHSNLLPAYPPRSISAALVTQLHTHCHRDSERVHQGEALVAKYASHYQDLQAPCPTSRRTVRS